MKILLAEDSPSARRLLISTLGKWNYEVVPAESGTQAWDILRTNDSPRLALLNWNLPGFSGVDLCRMLRERVEEPYIYLLLLTSKTSVESIVEGINSGADDYITKPFSPEELRVRLRAGKRILNLQAELVHARESMRDLAMRDELTGSWNRRTVFDLFGRELDRAERARTPLGVCMADIDHFKRVNDTYGHAAGDAVLCEVARRMHDCVRSHDLLGRYGGEEFLIVCPECSPANAAKLAERIRHAVADKPIDHKGTEIDVTISIGLATTLPEKDDTCEELVQIADTALYKAKDAGRNRVEVVTA